MAAGGDLIGVVEAAYQVDLTESQWLKGVLEAARPLLDRGLGVCAYRYDASNPKRFRAAGWTELGIRSPRFRRRVLAVLGQLDAAYVDRTCRTVAAQVGATLDSPELRGLFAHLIEPTGAADMLAVNAIDPGGHGVYLGAMLREGDALTRQREAVWNRVAAHIVAGFRLRQRLGEKEPEARLHPSGRIGDASGEAAAAHQALRRAAAALDRARGRLRKDSPQEAVGAWKGLVSARWTLIDEFDSLGRRYVLARRNEPAVTPAHELPPRELQAVGWALLGHSNKLIAYEMGISASTVGVLLHRAMVRVGAHSRAELLAAFRAIAAK